jgi:hypothetical protein
MGDLWGEEGFGGSGFGGESFGGEDDWYTSEESLGTDLEEGLVIDPEDEEAGGSSDSGEDDAQ